MSTPISRIRLARPSPRSGGFWLAAAVTLLAAPAFAQQITAVSPNSGGLDSVVVIDGSGFGPGRPRVVLTEGATRLPLKVKRFSSSQITARVARAVVGQWDVSVETAGRVIVAPRAFAVSLPSDLSFDRRSVGPGELVTMTGQNLGKRRGSIWLSNRRATVVSWTQDVGGLGTVVFRTPTFLPVGTYDVEVRNKLGKVNVKNALIVESGQPSIDADAPKVASAGSTSNTEVVVQFTEPMRGGADSAENPTYYRITSSVAGATGASTLDVLNAELIAPDPLTGGSDRVRLTTRSQSAILYTVKAVGVVDLAGNPLAGPGPFTDPTSTNFQGIGATVGSEVTDCDGDGLRDAEEQRGWIVRVLLLNGNTSERVVTSEPCVADTDGDGLDDRTEKEIVSDPRGIDTDGDLLNDYQEFNETYSNQFIQDTDGDTLDDGLEFTFFHTSPIQPDTDGDQLRDDVEISLSNRNPRVADLPGPTIEVGDIRLGMDVRFTETVSSETRVLQTKSVASTLQQNNSTETANSSSNTQEAMAKLSVGTEYKVKAEIFAAGGTFTSSINAETGWTGSWTHSSKETSINETQRAYETSLETEAEKTQGSTVTREVLGARMQATIQLKNASNLAFTVKNLQVTAFIQDPRKAGRLIPVATLLPDAEPADGFALGPLQRERGPLIFSNDTIFPSLVEELMKNPRGLVFKISNFDISDELGRNFVFTSQDIIDRTGTLVIDSGSFDGNGDGVGDLTEYNRVATSAGRVIDTNGDGVVDGSDHRVVFDGAGKQVGITLREALAALGLTRYDELTTPSASLSDAQKQKSYSTMLDPAGVERIFRLRKAAATDGVPKLWEIITPTGIDQTVGLDSFVLLPEEDVKLAFVQDVDRDRLESRTEYMNGCSDQRVDTDDDGLDDRFEVLIGWTVDDVRRGSRTVFSGCGLDDTDGDGLTDEEEAPDVLTRVDTDGDGTPDIITQATSTPGHRPTDPTSADTDRDGVSDFDEVRGYQVTIRADCNSPRAGQTVVVTSDPTNPDSDGDGADDGIERLLGGDPTNSGDFQCFGDNDGDGLVNLQETLGWDMVVEAVSSGPALCNIVCSPGSRTTVHVTSNPNRADTDGDGLSDGEEFDLKTDPRSADTDADGIPDFDEARGFILRSEGVISTDPTDADTDDDKLSDGVEAGRPAPTEVQKWIVRPVGKDPYQVFSDPLLADADFDRLADGDERAAGTDPDKGNTDEDARDDYVEVRDGTNPLVSDFRVTVGFRELKVIDDCDSGNDAGDFGFQLGVILPDGSYGEAASTYNRSDFVVPVCPDVETSFCRVENYIQIRGGTSFRFGNGTSITFGATIFDQFSLSGSVCENDGPSATTLTCDTPGAFPWEIDDPFLKIDIDGTPRSGFFTAAELSNGTIFGTITKPSGCKVELTMYISVSGKL